MVLGTVLLSCARSHRESSTLALPLLFNVSASAFGPSSSTALLRSARACGEQSAGAWAGSGPCEAQSRQRHRASRAESNDRST